MSRTTLYKRNGQGKPIQWSIWYSDVDTRKLYLQFGVVGKNGTNTEIRDTTTKGNLYNSMITAKRKEGYKSLSDLYDNAPTVLNGADLYKYLDTYLPKYNTTSDGHVLPMLAKILEDDKPIKSNGYMRSQYKINGLRCNVACTKDNYSLFDGTKFDYYSREGTKWHLPFLDDIINNSINKEILELMIEEGVQLDGEIYLPGYTVNDINSFVKNDKMPQHRKLQYWNFDLCMENADYDTRLRILHKCFNWGTGFTTKEEHLNNKKQFLYLCNNDVESFDEARYYRDDAIAKGFEGIILRDPKAEYQFGKRNSAMFKYKKVLDGMFRVIDIIPEGKRTRLCKFVLENDINDERFECTLNAPQVKQEFVLRFKRMYIGSNVLVEYRERSGVKQVPFHAKVVKVSDV